MASKPRTSGRSTTRSTNRSTTKAATQGRVNRSQRTASRRPATRTGTKGTKGKSARGNAGKARDFTGVEPNLETAEELILQALETEIGGVKVYRTAIACAENDELREEWEKYLEQTQHHVEVVEQLCQQLGLDNEKETPGRLVVRTIGEALVEAMRKAQSDANADAQVVAAECVTLAETKDHLNWSLLSELSKADFEWADAIGEACDEVEDEEDEHLYHTMGWCRELWIDCLGLPAALPPPEEERDVKSMAGAAKAKAARKKYVEA